MKKQNWAQRWMREIRFFFLRLFAGEDMVIINTKIEINGPFVVEDAICFMHNVDIRVSDPLEES